MSKKEAATTETETETPPTTEAEAEASKTTEVEAASAEASGDSEATSGDFPEFGGDQITDFLSDDDEIDEDAEVKSVETPEIGKEKEKPLVEEPKPETEAAPVEKPEGEKPGEASPEKVEEPKPEAAPTPAPGQAPPVTPTEPEPVAATPVAPTPEPTPVLSEAEQTEAYQKWRDGIETSLAEDRYAISEEEANDLDISPEAAKRYSRGLSRVYMDAITGAVGHMTQAMPQLLEAALATRDTTSQAEVDFFTAWPKLNAPENKETLSRLGKAYRQLNPNVPAADFIRDVGAQAHIALRIPVEEAVPAVPASGEAPPAPSAPFKPAGSGSPGGSPSGDKNAFTVLSEEFDEEELDLG